MPAEQKNGRFDAADHDDDELTSSCSIGCLLCSELGYKRPIKQSRAQEDVAQWVRAFTAEFAPSLASKPLSHLLTPPRRRPQSNHIPFAVAIAEHQKFEDDEPAPPSTAAASPAWTWYSFPPYPEGDDDDSDSTTSANEDCITLDPVDSASSSAAGVSAANPFEPLSPPRPSLFVAPMTSPQPINQTASDVAIGDCQEPEVDEPASPLSTTATSPACSYFSFPPYPERDDDSDSSTLADGDSQLTHSSSAPPTAGSFGSPSLKKVAASTHSRHSFESGSSVVSWFPLLWLPLKSPSKARTVYDRTQNPLSSVYARAEPSTLVSAVRPCAFPSRVTVEVPNSAFLENTYDWSIRNPLPASYLRFPLRWDKMALEERREPRYHVIPLLN